MAMRTSAWRIGIVMLLAPSAGLSEAGAAAELRSRTTAAYDAYVAGAEVAFLARARSEEPVPKAAPGSRADAVAKGRIVTIADGLVHHWRGAIHIPGVTLERVLATAQHYEAYPHVYASVAESRLLYRDDDRFHVLTRVRGSAGRVSVVLEVRSVIRYQRLATGAYSVGASQEVREVVGAGQPDERLLPAGRDSGYLWRANTFTRFVERDGGVDVELETVGLSRRFPPMLGWLIEPFARRLGRRSVERTLAEFDLAVRDDPSAAPCRRGGTS
jgi:hypothetical protein